MEDFNDAMANIDGGMSAAWMGLLRTAYNQYQLATLAERLPVQSGMFLQRLNSGAENTSGMMLWRDYGWIARSETAMKGSDLAAYFTVDQPMVMVKDDLAACVPMSATFTPPCPGQITRVTIRGNYNGCESERATWRIRFINLETGECEADQVCGAVLINGKVVAGEPVLDEVDLRFHTGVSYRLEVIPMDATVNGTFKLGYHRGSSYSMAGTGSAVWTLTDPAGGADALALIHYGSYGKGGTVSLAWDGKAMTPRRTRTFTDNKGRTVTELEYRRGGPVDGSSELRLTASCPAGGELCIYNWGAVLV